MRDSFSLKRERGTGMLHDKDIREPLFEYLEETYGKIRIIEEKTMGRSRADVVMVRPGDLVGIEIKSDADTYARLKRQIRDYNRYYEYNCIVVGTRHAFHVKEHVPDCWGIITVEEAGGAPDFYMYRTMRPNPEVEWKRRMEILWRPELSHLLELNQLPKYRQKSKGFVVEKLLERVPKELLARQVSEELFERDYNTIAGTIAEYRKKR